ncbi:MAG: hypothetical protein P4N59_01205 [Negativicutes bacterium]|nr:hypothetical protein [Negativicutes bacterium]
MPYCKICHNARLFGSSKVPPAAPSANGPLSGLNADFDLAGKMTSVTRLGADKAAVRAATANPRDYFDVCLKCGSSEIEWDETAGGMGVEKGYSLTGIEDLSR